MLIHNKNATSFLYKTFILFASLAVVMSIHAMKSSATLEMGSAFRPLDGLTVSDLGAAAATAAMPAVVPPPLLFLRYEVNILNLNTSVAVINSVPAAASVISTGSSSALANASVTSAASSSRSFTMAVDIDSDSYSENIFYVR